MNPQDLKNRTKQFALILECADMSALSKAVPQPRDRRTPKRVEPDQRSAISDQQSEISNQQYEHDNSITSFSHDDLNR